MAALLGVVALHVRALGFFPAASIWGFSLDAVSRFAVPTFFIISGYFLRVDSDTPISHYLKHVGRRMTLPYAIWFFIYNHRFTDIDMLKGLRMFFIGGGEGFHLWFVPALVVGSLVVILLEHKGIILALTTGLALYLFAVWLREFSTDFSTLPNWSTRNGLFMAPVFIAMGRTLRLGLISKIQGKWTPSVLVYGGLFLHLIETSWLSRAGDSGGLDMSVGLLFLAPGLFIATLRVNLPTHEWISSWGRNVFGGYLCHLMTLFALAQWFPFQSDFLASFAIIVVWISSLTFSRAIECMPVLRGVLQ